KTEDNLSIVVGVGVNDGTSTGNSSLTVIVEDDSPIAAADTNSVNEGASLNVLAAAGVLINDKAGADGYTSGGGVVGVRAAGGDTTTAVTTGVNTQIAGLYGTLDLQADGSYTYTTKANTITADQQDVFVYTIKDADGDLSTTTLTIDVHNVTLTGSNDDE